jgi:lysozyme
MSLWGVDISNHQPGADLAKAKAAGCSFVFAKATEGATYADPYFAGFRTKAAQLGLPLGAYHFARPQPGRTGAQEAGAFLHVVGTVRAGELPCVLDLEDTKIGPQATADWALEWLLAVHRATGVRPMVYTYSAFAAAKLFPAAQLATYPLWLANYRSISSPPSAPMPWKSWALWQHTSAASVPGIPGDADRNITNLSAAQLSALGRPSQEADLTPDEHAMLVNASRMAEAASVRTQRIEGALKALASSLPASTAKAVTDALDATYDATVELTPKAGA